MGQEIEIKLTIDAAQLDRILAHPLVARYTAGERLQLELLNTYYDTPALALYHHRMALRVRRKGDRFVQTLKTCGESRNGLSRRGEWEWSLPDEALRPERVPKELWPPGMEAQLHQIAPVFLTDFNRILCRITLPENLLGPGQPAAGIELALDRGKVLVTGLEGAFSEVISEIEMELKYGEVVTLQAFSLAVSSGLPVSPCDVSKAERGYRLLASEKFQK